MGEPLVKYLGNKIWELRPLRHRILFFEDSDCFVLLSHFVKETKKHLEMKLIKLEKE